MKRVLDIVLSGIGIIILTPLIVISLMVIFFNDWHNPLYISKRMGLRAKPFNFIKFRTMIPNASSSGVDSTSKNDARITRIGKLLRQTKFDEIPQLVNVLIGQMSLVGPRPNVERETSMYTEKEKMLFLIKPGITDFSSIIFSDLGEILSSCENPDIAYNQLVRPWKSRFGLFYVENNTFLMDLFILFYTGVSFFSREKALRGIHGVLIKYKADPNLVSISLRSEKLRPDIPPGATKIVTERLSGKVNKF